MNTVVSDKKIREHVELLGNLIREIPDYKDEEITLLIVLTGAIIFASDLMRRLRGLKVRLTFVKAQSYDGEVSGGLSIDDSMLGKLENSSIKGRHILIVDDIYDSGKTLHQLNEIVRKEQPKSQRNCVLLKKNGTQIYDVAIDFPSIPIPNKYVVGYGMDFDGLYRNLPFVAVLPKIHQKPE